MFPPLEQAAREEARDELLQRRDAVRRGDEVKGGLLDEVDVGAIAGEDLDSGQHVRGELCELAAKERGDALGDALEVEGVGVPPPTRPPCSPH